MTVEKRRKWPDEWTERKKKFLVVGRDVFLVTDCLNKHKVKYGFPNMDFDADKVLQCQSNGQQWKIAIENEGRECLKREDR